MVGKSFLHPSGLAILLFGSIILICFLTGADKAWEKFKTYFQLFFWYRFIFTKFYSNQTIESMEHLNELINRNFKDNSFYNRHVRYCLKLINKRNNYTA